MQNSEVLTDEYDKEFILLVMEIEKRYDTLSKHNRLRIESWCKKLCQITNNREWKKNRNLHAICLLDMILNKHFESPYNKFAPEGPVPIISKSIVKARLSSKFAEVMANQSENTENLENNKVELENSSYVNEKSFNSKKSNLKPSNTNIR